MTQTQVIFLPDIQVNATFLAKKHWLRWLFFLTVFLAYHEITGKWEIIFLIPFVVSVFNIVQQFFIPFRVLSVEFYDELGKLIVHYKPRMHPAIAMQISYERLQVKVYQRKGWWTNKLREKPTKIVLLNGKTEMIDLDEEKGFSDALLAQTLVKLSSITNHIMLR